MRSLGQVSKRGGVGSPNGMVTPSQLLSGSSHLEPSGGTASRKAAPGSSRSAPGPVATRLMLNQGVPGWVELHRQPGQDFDRAPPIASLGAGPILTLLWDVPPLAGSRRWMPPSVAMLAAPEATSGAGWLINRGRDRRDTGLDRPSCRAAALAHLDRRPGPPSTAIPRVVPFPTEKNPSRLRKDLRNVA